MNFAVVSAADAVFFDRLCDLLASLEDAFHPQRPTICILDVGLLDGQADALRQRGCQLKVPGWDLSAGPGVEPPSWLRAMTARPFLPRHFPGHGLYVWLDSDTWVQDAGAIRDLVAIAEAGDVAIVQETYSKVPVEAEAAADATPIGRFRVSEPIIRRNLARAYAILGRADADTLAQGPIFNSGVFCLAEHSPVWADWAARYEIGFQREWFPLIEQQALSLALWLGRYPVRILPQRYNWNLGAREPLLDPASGRLLTPDGAVIGIVHLQELKRARSYPMPIVGGGHLTIPLSYTALREMFAGKVPPRT